VSAGSIRVRKATEADRPALHRFLSERYSAVVARLTLHAATQWTGAGTALVEAVESKAERPWVLTTNDNVDALRFYQRRGFRLKQLRPGAVDESRRRLKPEVPEAGEYGIPLRDEIVLEKEISAWRR
jgi:GNAT superfamily N-acetyltransferase